MAYSRHLTANSKIVHDSLHQMVQRALVASYATWKVPLALALPLALTLH